MKIKPEINERREFKRFPVNEQGFLISQERDGEVFPVLIHDVSNRGIGFTANRFFTNNKKFTIQYSILNHEFNIPIKIAWTLSTHDGISIGCRKIPM